MDKRDLKKPEAQREQAGHSGQPLRKDLFAGRKRLYDRIRIPLKTMDYIIYALVAALVVALILGIGSNR